MRYPIRLDPAAGSLWRATVLDLPGCTVYGRGLEEAIAAAREAVRRHLQSRLQDGRPLPKPAPVEVHLPEGQCSGAIWSVIDLAAPAAAAAQ